MEHLTYYRTVEIDGLSIFYREAGPKNRLEYHVGQLGR